MKNSKKIFLLIASAIGIIILWNLNNIKKDASQINSNVEDKSVVEQIQPVPLLSDVALSNPVEITKKSTNEQNKLLFSRTETDLTYIVPSGSIGLNIIRTEPAFNGSYYDFNIYWVDDYRVDFVYKGKLINRYYLNNFEENTVKEFKLTNYNYTDGNGKIPIKFQIFIDSLNKDKDYHISLRIDNENMQAIFYAKMFNP